jgi:serine/threonine-protein kinase RsbW
MDMTPDQKTESENVELYLPAVLGYEKVARSAAEVVARKMDFSEDRIEDLKTAVAEACMNAIEHGSHLERSATVTVLLSAEPSKIEVRVADSGEDAIPNPPPEPDQRGERGWGLFFIQHLMDEVEITHLPEGGNQVRMVIYITPPDQAAPSSFLPAEEVKRPLELVPSYNLAIQPADPAPAEILPALEPPRSFQPAEIPLDAILPLES